jgi:RNA polymerase sigma factor (sigma-70 family)
LANPLDDWVRATLPRALGYARALLHNPVDADDVVQDCYARLIERADRYDLPRDGLKLLLRSVTNACIDRRCRERVLLSLDGAPEAATGGVVDRASPDPPQQAIARELAERIEAALAKLPVGQRAAIHLTCLGYSLQEVAEMIGTSPGNARVLVHRARKNLAADLGPFLLETNDESARPTY